MRRILKTCNIQDENHVFSSMITPNWWEMTSSSLKPIIIIMLKTNLKLTSMTSDQTSYILLWLATVVSHALIHRQRSSQSLIFDNILSKEIYMFFSGTFCLLVQIYNKIHLFQLLQLILKTYSKTMTKVHTWYIYLLKNSSMVGSDHMTVFRRWTWYNVLTKIINCAFICPKS